MRRPSVDVGAVDGAVQELLVNAWRAGNGVDAAINNVLGNNSIVSKLTSQVEAQLEYQRQVGIDAVMAEYNSRIAAVEAQRQEQIEVVKAELMNYDSDAALKNSEAEVAKEEEVYSATLKSLEEIRVRVQAELSRVGGQEGLEALAQIKKTLVEPTHLSYAPLPAPCSVSSPSVPYEKQNFPAVPSPTSPSNPTSAQEPLETPEPPPIYVPTSLEERIAQIEPSKKRFRDYFKWLVWWRS
jgi:hypothetical protein